MTNIQEEVLEFMQKIQALGYAVAVFTPEELRDANPKSVEREMISAGFNEIEYLQEDVE